MISVIIPVYNTQAYLPRCLDSLLVQSHPHLEVLLVDDGSTDGSGTICDAYARKHPHFRVIHKENGGVSSARNKGIEKAKGELLCFVDSDDTLAATHFEVLYKAQRKHDADIVITGVQMEMKKGWHNVSPPDADVSLAMFKNDIGVYGHHIILNAPFNKLYKKSIIEAFSLRFDTAFTIGEDQIFNLAYLRHCQRIATRPTSTYLYHFNGGSAMNRHNALFVEQNMALTEKTLSFFSASPASEKALYLFKNWVSVYRHEMATIPQRKEKKAARKQILQNTFYRRCLPQLHDAPLKIRLRAFAMKHAFIPWWMQL